MNSLIIKKWVHFYCLISINFQINDSVLPITIRLYIVDFAYLELTVKFQYQENNHH